MTAELISVGTELLMGNIVNSNTRFRKSVPSLDSICIIRSRWGTITDG